MFHIFFSICFSTKEDNKYEIMWRQFNSIVYVLIFTMFCFSYEIHRKLNWMGNINMPLTLKTNCKWSVVHFKALLKYMNMARVYLFDSIYSIQITIWENHLFHHLSGQFICHCWVLFIDGVFCQNNNWWRLTRRCLHCFQCDCQFFSFRSLKKRNTDFARQCVSSTNKMLNIVWLFSSAIIRLFAYWSNVRLKA